MSRLTPLEEECRDILLVVQEMLTPRWSPKAPRHDFMEIMGRVRMAIVHLTNKEFGCDSGKHSGPCSCENSKIGTTTARVSKKTI